MLGKHSISEPSTFHHQVVCVCECERVHVCVCSYALQIKLMILCLSLPSFGIAGLHAASSSNLGFKNHANKLGVVAFNGGGAGAETDASL